MNFFILEDTESDYLRLKHHLDSFIKEKQLELNIYHFTNGDELLSTINEKSIVPSLCFLDIYMAGKNGIEVATSIRESNLDCEIIFTTTSTEHAMESYKVNAAYYLQKPYSHEDFLNAMARCKKTLENSQKTFSFAIHGRPISIPLSEICYLESGRHVVNLHTKNETYTFYGSIAETYAKLKGIGSFIPCGRSFIVNLSHVKKLFGADLIMEDESIVQVPLREKNSVLDALSEWQKRNQ